MRALRVRTACATCDRASRLQCIIWILFLAFACFVLYAASSFFLLVFCCAAAAAAASASAVDFLFTSFFWRYLLYGSQLFDRPTHAVHFWGDLKSLPFGVSACCLCTSICCPCSCGSKTTLAISPDSRRCVYLISYSALLLIPLWSLAWTLGLCLRGCMCACECCP